MSEVVWARWRRTTRQFPCGDCGAAPTKPCKTKPGGHVTGPHRDRKRQWREKYNP